MIQAIFPAGVTAMTLNGLHQWDYGRKLQIGAEGIPALVEVHFACPGMTEAIVRVASATDSYTVTIPDRCLEQSAPVTAWVVFVDETSSKTAMELTLPITPRPRPMPAVTPDVVQEDRYNELFAAVETALGELDGIVENTKSASEDAAASADSANSSAASATSSATAAEGFKNAAEGFKNEASEAAVTAKDAADRMENAIDFADSFLRENLSLYSTALDAVYKALFYCKGAGQLFGCWVKDNDGHIRNVGVVYCNANNTGSNLSQPFFLNGSSVAYYIVFRVLSTPTTDSNGVAWHKVQVSLASINEGELTTETRPTCTLYVQPLTVTYTLD